MVLSRSSLISSSLSSRHNPLHQNPTPTPTLALTPLLFYPKTQNPKPPSRKVTLPLSHSFSPSRTQNSSLFVHSKNPISPCFSANKNDPDDISVDYDDEKPREECGVVGIYGDPEAFRLCYLALHALQHRGQEGAGIVCVKDNVLQTITGVGLVSEDPDAGNSNHSDSSKPTALDNQSLAMLH